MSVETAAAEIERIADATGGIVGVSATQLATGRHLGYCEDELFPTASVIKLPLLVTLYEDAIAGVRTETSDIPLQARPAGGAAWKSHAMAAELYWVC